MQSAIVVCQTSINRKDTGQLTGNHQWDFKTKTPSPEEWNEMRDSIADYLNEKPEVERNVRGQNIIILNLIWVKK